VNNFIRILEIKEMLKGIFRSSIFWTIIIGLITVGVSGYLFLLSDKRLKPVYATVTKPSIIYDKDNSSAKLRLLISDTVYLNKNVYVTSIAVWNAGRHAISSSDVRDSIKVTLSDSADLLDYTIIKESHAGISNFRFQKIDNQLYLDWDYFDPGYGFEFQVIYSGENNSSVALEGMVFGNRIKEVQAKRALATYEYIIAPIICLIMILTGIVTFLEIKQKNQKGLSAIVNLLIGSGLILFGFYYVYRIFIMGFRLPF